VNAEGYLFAYRLRGYADRDSVKKACPSDNSLAQKCGIHPGYLSKLLNGKMITVTLERLWSMCGGLSEVLSSPSEITFDQRQRRVFGRLASAAAEDFHTRGWSEHKRERYFRAGTTFATTMAERRGEARGVN